MSLDEINARLASLGRPVVADFRHVTNLGLMADLRRRQDLWDTANPTGAAEYRELRKAGEAAQEALDTARRLEANKSGDLAWMKRLVGDKIGDNLGAPRNEPAMMAARQWLESGGWCLSLFGTKGNGKTFAAARATLESGLRPVLWLHSPSACLQPVYGPIAQANLVKAQTSPLFVLDEFGAELVSAPYMTWLEAVLGVRYSRGLRTILTSNLNAEGFKARLGDRLTDRVREGTVFESSGPSLRRRGQRQINEQGVS